MHTHTLSLSCECVFVDFAGPNKNSTNLFIYMCIKIILIHTCVYIHEKRK